jgi:hypothetical protein
MILKIIYALLTNTPAISAQVGTRIYPLVVPEDVQKPALAYQVISESRDYLMSGQDAVTESRVQITIVAESVSQMDTVAEALRSELSGYSGMVQSEKVYLITLENEYDGAVADGESLRVLRQDYTIRWKEA